MRTKKKDTKKFDAPVKTDERTNEELHSAVMAIADGGGLLEADARDVRELAQRFETACRQLAVTHKPENTADKFKVHLFGQSFLVDGETFAKLNPGGKDARCNEQRAEEILTEAGYL